MKTNGQRLGFRRTAIALAVFAALGQAHAQESASPQSWVSIGGIAANGDSQDRARFGLYNGMREDRGYGLFDFGFRTGDAATGLWTTIEGRNLFLDTREVSLTARKLGDWKLSAGYSEISRASPYTINTGLQGAGTTTPAVTLLASPGTGSDLNLDTKRKAVSLAGSKWLGGDLQFEASLKSEDKEGARLFGRGFACSATWVAAGACAATATQAQWALLMTPEPIDSTINQAEAKLTLSSGGLLLTAGYYGNIYVNRHSSITPSSVPGSLLSPLNTARALDAGLRNTLALPLALPPDSQSHQFYLAGNYRFTPTTVANFKYAYTRATQDEDFGADGFFDGPPGRDGAEAKVVTKLAQFGITSRPVKKLTLTANIRQEDKDDQTPVDFYNVEGGPTTLFTNSPASKKRTTGKVEGSYLLPGDYRATLGLDLEKVDHGEFASTSAVAGLSGLKQKTKEQGYRVELRKSLSESLTGFIAYVYSKREGDSPWLKPTPGGLATGARGVIEANDDPSCVPPAAPALNNCIYNRTGIFPNVFEDRKRNKVRAMVSWTPADNLSLQFMAEDGKDEFTGPTTKGLSESGMSNYSLDASYKVSDDWSVSGYASRGDSTYNVAHSSAYMVKVKDTNTAVGATLKGKVSERLRVSADLSFANDKVKYPQELDQNASAANIAYLATYGGLPDVTYKVTRLTVKGDYDLSRQSSIRLLVGYEKSNFDEWTWQWNGNAFRFSDNTTVWAQENQSVGFAGVTWTYRW